MLARNRTASPKVASAPAAVHRQTEATPALQPPPAVQASSVPPASVPAPEPPPSSKPAPLPKVIAADPEPRTDTKTRPSRTFVAPAARPIEAQNSLAALPAPPRTEPLPGPEVVHVLPPGILGTSSIPMPPPPATVTTPAAAAPEKPKPVTGGVATAARLIKQTPPVYPQTALKHGLVGDVKIQAIVDEHGNITNVKVLSGDAVLVAAAKTAVLQWKYAPSTLNGNPVAAPISIVISFENKNH
jgi:TonB family protein